MRDGGVASPSWRRPAPGRARSRLGSIRKIDYLGHRKHIKARHRRFATANRPAAGFEMSAAPSALNKDDAVPRDKQVTVDKANR